MWPSTPNNPEGKKAQTMVANNASEPKSFLLGNRSTGSGNWKWSSSKIKEE